tara:strand:+ start:1143 stop:1439 length:297 start_codon:yes stop_codon:yes gene_type:complete
MLKKQLQAKVKKLEGTITRLQARIIELNTPCTDCERLALEGRKARDEVRMLRSDGALDTATARIKEQSEMINRIEGRFEGFEVAHGQLCKSLTNNSGE